MFVSVDGRVAGLLAVADPVKPSTKEAIDLLHREGLRVVMLTGDNQTTADAVGKALGLDDIRADVLPAQKRDVILELQRQGRVVAMAGDGINDAPALAAAEVGIAMGTGTDVAMESAGITLVKGDLRGIARARRLSRATMRNIRQTPRNRRHGPGPTRTRPAARARMDPGTAGGGVRSGSQLHCRHRNGQPQPVSERTGPSRAGVPTIARRTVQVLIRRQPGFRLEPRGRLRAPLAPV